MVDFQSLYPVVRDLTEEEYASPYACCDLSSIVTDAYQYSATPFYGVSQEQHEATNTKGLLRRRSKEMIQERDAPQDEGEEIATRLQTFESAYVLTRQISAGSFSTVWETIHRTTGMRYATKILDRRTLTPEDEEDVYKEAAVLNAIKDTPGCCFMQEFFDEPTHFYLVLHYVEGGTLMSRVMEQPYCKEQEAKELAKTLLSAVRNMHAKGVCHRDLKPENIVLDGSNACICDFGMATTDKTTKEQCGTPSFVAPEVLKNQDYNTQADIWSVGVTLYFCMTGRLPFESKSKRHMFKKICKGEFSFDYPEWNHFSRKARSFLANLLQVDPTRRLTADEALNHVWLASSAASDSSSCEGSEPRKKKRVARKHIRRVWFALSRQRSSGKEGTGSERSVSSQTLSLNSSSDLNTTIQSGDSEGASF